MKDQRKELAQDNDKLEERDADNQNRAKLPIDRGWAWVILVASTAEMFIIIGMMRCYGIFFLEFQHKFISTSSVTALISTLQNLVYSISGLFVMTVGLRFVSTRRCIVFGGLLTGLGYIVTAFLENITAVVLINGAFVGFSLSFVYGPMVASLNSYFKRHLGLANSISNSGVSLGNFHTYNFFSSGFSLSFVYGPMVASLNSYFKRHLGLANSISNSGVSLGGLLLAPLFTYLFKEYGYRGAFLIAAGFYFNIIVFGLLFRPKEFYTKQKQNYGSSKNIEHEIEPLVKYNIRKDGVLRNTVEDNGNFELSVNSAQNTVNKNETLPFLEKEESKLTTVSPKQRQDTIIIDGKLANLQNDHIHVVTLDRNQRKSGILRNIVKLLKTIFDLTILKEPLFLYYLVCTIFLCSGNASSSFYVAPFANEIGLDADDTALILMVVNIVDLFARIIIGFISDRNWLRRSNLIALSSCILGVVCCFVDFVNCFVSLVAFAVVVGLLQGVYWSLFAVVIVDYLTQEKLKGALGFCGLVQGLSIGCAIPIAGFRKDATGTYVMSYAFVGGLLLTGSVLTALLPFVQRWLLKRAHKNVTAVT